MACFRQTRVAEAVLPPRTLLHAENFALPPCAWCNTTFGVFPIFVLIRVPRIAHRHWLPAIFSPQAEVSQGISAVGLSFACFNCRDNRHSLPTFHRKEITHLEAVEIMILQESGKNRHRNLREPFKSFVHSSPDCYRKRQFVHKTFVHNFGAPLTPPLPTSKVMDFDLNLSWICIERTRTSNRTIEHWARNANSPKIANKQSYEQLSISDAISTAATVAWGWMVSQPRCLWASSHRSRMIGHLNLSYAGQPIANALTD